MKTEVVGPFSSVGTLAGAHARLRFETNKLFESALGPLKLFPDRDTEEFLDSVRTKPGDAAYFDFETDLK